VPNSVDPCSVQTVDESAKDDAILYVGSMTQNKRPLVLLKAFDIVAKVIPTATLYLCGKGPQMEAIRREIATRGLAERVKCLSYVNQQTLNRIRAKTTLFVLPSATEGLSLALLEAMAAGQAVIASRNESHATILDNGENALLFEIDDSEELARQIMVAIGDRALRSRISRSAKNLVEKEFSNIVVAERLESIYLRALGMSSTENRRIPEDNPSSTVVDGENGPLVERDNAEDLGNKMMLEMTDGKMRSILSESARYLCQTHFSRSVVVTRLESL
jgi:glycosyltransferase involved in cell wall biosynthesis